ncbi:MAG: tetratricopeptide repeat protein, partial [Woeseiaceae bacterium]
MRLWRELRRRRLPHTAGLYIVGAWVIIQVTEALFQAWGIPETSNRYVFIAAALCFPIALVFGWIYDITGKGIVRTRDARSEKIAEPGLGRRDYLILTTLAAISITVIAGNANLVLRSYGNQVASATRLENSIAVLPFDNLNKDPETGAFSDGVSAEMQHRLSTLRLLNVIAAPSSFAMRNSQESAARIAEILGVQYLLQGNVRRDRNTVRITASLLDDTGRQVWSKTFDRQLEGIFAIQSEIASSVSGEILNKIVPLDELPAGRTTDSLDAYSEFLVGQAYYTRRTPGWQERAAAAFRRAIDIDATFAPAQAGLAIALYINTGPATLDEVRERATLALELDPQLADAHAIFGLMTYEQDGDTETAIEHLRQAIALDPSFAQAYNWLAIALQDAGRMDEARQVQEQGLVVDPLNPPLVANMASAYAFDGDPERARQLISRLQFLPEVPGLAHWELLDIETTYGRHDEAALVAFDTVRAYANTSNGSAYSALAFVYERLSMPNRAEYWFAMHDDAETNATARLLRRLYWYRQRGESAATRSLLEEASLPPESDWPQLGPFVRSVLGAAHIYAGMHDKGIRIFTAAGEPDYRSVAEELGPVLAMDFLHALAIGYSSTGKTDKALHLLNDIRETMESG